MAITAENLAEQYKLSREECDTFALRSQLNWVKGILLFNITRRIPLKLDSILTFLSNECYRK